MTQGWDADGEFTGKITSRGSGQDKLTTRGTCRILNARDIGQDVILGAVGGSEYDVVEGTVY